MNQRLVFIGAVMAAVKVAICPGEIIAGVAVIATVAGVPPE